MRGTAEKENAKRQLEEPKSKRQKKDVESEEEDRIFPEEKTKERFQVSDTVVASKNTPTGGRMNLAVRKA